MKNVNVQNQFEAFEEFKKNNKDIFSNLTPLNMHVQYYNQNRYKGVKTTPFFSIDRRYTGKKLTVKKKVD